MFIESAIDGYAQLVGAIAPGTEIVVLDAGRDGFAQIAEALAGRREVGAVHIVSHGADGMLKLGTATLRADNLGEHSAALQAIKASLAPGADILLYGCNIGRGDAGAALLDGLADLTGAGIAASTDATGAASLGGDWELERGSGQVEAAVIFNTAAAQRFQGLLAVPADEHFSFTPDSPDPAGLAAAAAPRTIGGFVYTGGGSGFTAWVQDGPANAVSIGSGNVIAINLEYVPISYIEIHSSSLADNFKLLSLLFEAAEPVYTGTNSFTVTGYDNGVQVTSDSLDAIVGDSSGSVHFTKAGTVLGGTLTFDASWQNVDTIRFTAIGGIPVLFFDDIDIDTAVVPPTITSASYDAATAILTVTGAGLAIGATVDVSKLTLTGESGGSYTLTSVNVTASSATTFTVNLNATDKVNVNGLLNTNGPTAFSGTTYNIGAAAGWVSGAAADASGNAVTVTSTAAPQVTSAAYDAGTNVLTVTGSNLVRTLGPNNDVTVSKLTLTGEGGSTYTLTGSNVEINSETAFTVTLTGADLSAVEQMFNKNGATSTGLTAYNLSAADDWNSVVHGPTADATGTVTVSNVPAPTITSATYNAAIGALAVIGTGLVHANGAANDIVVNKFTITGQGGAVYTLTDTPFVEITSGTGFTLVLSNADRTALTALLDQNGAGSSGGTTYNLAAASNWAAGAAIGAADLTGNGITVTNITRPTVSSIALSDTALKAGDTAIVTVVFSEAVSGFSAADISAANATVGAPSTSNGGVTWTFTLTPSAGVTDAANAVTVDTAYVTNGAGYAGTSSTSSPNYTIDTLRPTAAINVADSTLVAGETAPVTITFSEAVTGFDNADLTVANGTLSPVATLDGGLTWTATFTPSASVTDSTNLITLSNADVSDLAGNAGTGTTASNNYSISTVRPTATIAVADSAIKIGDTALVTITFSEAVSGFDNADLTVANGTLSAVGSGNGGITWTATFTPQANATAGSNVITLDNTRVVNGAGNAGSGSTSSNNYTIDTARPSATITLADVALKAGESSLVTVAFSEAVTGFSNAALAVANGTLGALASLDGGVTWTATFTPDAGVTASANLITLDNTGVLDVAGNAGAGTTDSNSYAIDTAPPTATITVADTVLAPGETSLVTIAFSEAVTGFANGDLTVANGTLGPVASPDGGRTWNATFTPDTNVTDTTNVITLAATGVLDAAGNPGIGTVDSNNYAVQTVNPTGSIVVADSALKAGETSLVTITFSEAVTGLANAGLTVPNGTLGTVATLDGGVTWSATFTPDANITDTTNVITLDATGVTNGAGNPVNGTLISNNYAIDTARPTATLTVDSGALAPGASATVTIRFSEAVTGFGLEDMTAGSGGLANLASTDGGLTWSARLTADPGAQADINAVRVRTSGVADAAGNAGAMEAVSNNYSVGSRPIPTIDGVPATITRAIDPVTGVLTETIVVPVITGTRVDDPGSPNRGLADIPLGIRDASGAVLAELTVSLPTGTGMVAQGPAALLSTSEALLDLVRRIETRTEAGPGRSDMTGQGASFLGTLDPNATLETRTLVLTGAGSAPGQPIQITGAPGQGGAGVALVIDATGLPAGTVLHLNDVEFAAVIGAVTLGGGGGRNFVVGDGAAQNISLGAGDDVLHGGGGNDIVAGGRNDTGQWQFFMDATGQLSARHDTAVAGPASWETVARGELDPGATGLGFLNAPAAKLQELALLYQAALGRVADLAGLEFWAANGGSAREVMALFMQQSEYASGAYSQLGDEAFVRAVYSGVLGREADAPGVAYWTAQLGPAGRLTRSDMLAGFALSDEHKGHVSGAGGLALGQGMVAQPAQWFGGSGDDILDGGPGNDLLVGGDGIDTVVYSGMRSQYHVVVGKDGSIRIADSANGDIDTVKGIERGQFADGVVDLRFTQAKAGALQTVGLLYQTLFDRPGDPAGFGWWLGLHSDALGLAQSMAGTAEFKARYGALEDASFVKALFDNTGLQAGQAGGMAYWQDYLRSHTRADTVAAWIGHAEVIGTQFGGDGLWIV